MPGASGALREDYQGRLLGSLGITVCVGQGDGRPPREWPREGLYSEGRVGGSRTVSGRVLQGSHMGFVILVAGFKLYL